MSVMVTTIAGCVGFAAALAASYKEKSLVTVALLACAAVSLAEETVTEAPAATQEPVEPVDPSVIDYDDPGVGE